MMIEHMNDEEKSVLLAKAMGLEVRDWHTKQFIKTPEGQIIEADLYLPANMALAKRTIEWGAANIPPFKQTLKLIGYNMWVLPHGVTELLDEIAIYVIEESV